MNKIANIKKKILRIYHQLYALSHGYFWLPSPICSKNFGGHEYAHCLYTDGNADLPSGGLLVCSGCEDEAKRRNTERYGYA